MTTISWPQANQVLQQQNGQIDSLIFRWRGPAPLFIQLYKDGVLFATQADGVFSGIPAGWYTAEASTGEGISDKIKFGVGDVFVVPGQSNGVSQRQPDSYIAPIPPEGRVSLSDYFAPGKGMFEFRDPAANPLDEPVGTDNAGVCWLHCALELDRPYPVMFVIVAVGNTSSQQWADELSARLFEAYVTYKPKCALLMHGETDSSLLKSQGEYYSNWSAVITSLREICTMPWVVAVNSLKEAGMPATMPDGYGPVRAAQIQLINSSNASGWPTIYQGPDTDIIRKVGEGEFQGDDLELVGQAWANSINAADL